VKLVSNSENSTEQTFEMETSENEGIIDEQYRANSMNSSISISEVEFGLENIVYTKDQEKANEHEKDFTKDKIGQNDKKDRKKAVSSRKKSRKLMKDSSHEYLEESQGKIMQKKIKLSASFPSNKPKKNLAQKAYKKLRRLVKYMVPGQKSIKQNRISSK